MKIIQIDNPNDIIFPLGKEIFENQKIFYHGTWSTFSNLIELKGWIVNDIPYDIEDVKYICNICKDIGINRETYYGLLKYFTLSLGGDNDQIIKFPSFSPNYWISRNFAGYRGGETIAHILEATQEILNYNRTAEPEYLETIRRIQNKYEKLTHDGYGVVYVVEAEPDWFSNWKDFDKEPQTELILQNGLPSKSIQTRIDYPKGITPFRPDYDYALPLSWCLEPFKRNLKKSQYNPSDSILKEFLEDSN